MCKKKEKEEAIFNAALRVIKEKGSHKARMADISKESGISYGLIYHYFRGKEELFEEIHKRWWEGLFGLMKGVNQTGFSVPDRLNQIIYYFLDQYQMNPELVNIFITEISRSTSNLTKERLNYFKRFMDLTDSIMEEGQRTGFLRKDFKKRYLTYIFLGALETFVSAMVLVDQRIKGDDQKQRIAKSILEIFLNGARAR